MALPSGTRLGPYEVLSAAGAGGIGEVYRARDTRLDRVVAIKILHSHLSSSPEVRQRFEREARVVSSLNHPHICTLHDFGHHMGMDYLVMEYLEGETLADRLRRGALPLNQLLKIASELSQALDKAHQLGIVHRDLKPGNVMVTEMGVKLMDFGLAKPAIAAVAAGGAEAETLSKPLTQEGRILGTFQYMSPEQLEGKEADARSDIFAFGAVLYEMVTGRRAFEGKTSVSVIGAILEKDPEPISKLNPIVPPALEHVVRTCLAKDPQDRWQSVHDINRELEWIQSSQSESQLTSASARNQWGLPLGYTAGIIAAILLIAATVGWRWYVSKPQTSTGIVAHFAVRTPPEAHLDESFPGLAVSPDGIHIVALVKTQTGSYSLYLYSLEDAAGRLIPERSVQTASFFSPDGQWLALVAGKKIQKMALSADQLLDVCSLPDVGGGGSWASDGNIYFGIISGGISRVASSGGVPEPVTKLDSGEERHDWPQLLPNGKDLLFTARRRALGDAILVQSLKSGKRRIVLENASRGTYIPTGHLLFFRANALWAVPFDVERLLPTGPEFILPYKVFIDNTSSWVNPEFSVSPAGTLVYAPAGEDKYTVTMVDMRGAATSVAIPAGNYWDPRLSPDGRALVVSVAQALEQSLWLFDLTRESPTRISNGMVLTGDDMSPAWSPDGRILVFTRGHLSTGTSLMWMPSDRSAEPQKLYEFPKGFVAATSWSSDSQRLGLIEYEFADDKLQIRTLRIRYLPASVGRMPELQTAGEPVTVANASGQSWQAMLSPDARWIAYTSDESGRNEVYVRAAEPGGGRWQVSSEGGLQPHWSPNGKEIYYRIGEKMMAVDVVLQPTFAAGRPRLLFEGPYELGGAVNGYDLTPDGREFLMLRDNSSHHSVSEYKVITNWFQELRKFEAAHATSR